MSDGSERVTKGCSPAEVGVPEMLWEDVLGKDLLLEVGQSATVVDSHFVPV